MFFVVFNGQKEPQTKPYHSLSPTKPPCAQNEGSPSQQLSLKTDVSGPLAPTLTNLTCEDEQTLHLEWMAPAPHAQVVVGIGDKEF